MVIDSTTRRWTFVQAMLLIVSSIAAYWHVWFDIFTIANHDEESSHILLVPLVVAWLFWCRKQRLESLFSGGRRWGLMLIAASLLFHEVGLSCSITAAWHLSAVVCLVGGLVATFGASFVDRYLPAIIAMLFLVPVPGLLRQQASIPLQHACAFLTQKFLSTFGLDIVQQGNMLLLDGVSLTIAEACTGVRMLLAIVVVVYALCFSIQSSNAVKWCLLIFSPIIAMALNIVRLIATVACYSFYDTGTAEAFHDASGWIIPAFFILGVVFYTRQFDLPPLPNLRNSEAQNTHSYVGAICAALLMMIMVRNSYVPPSRVAIANHRASVEKLVLALPYVVGNWIADEQDLHPQEIKLLKPIASFRRKYHNVVTGDIISMVAIATSHGRDLIGHEPGICFVGQGWCKISQQPTHWTSESSLVNGVNYRFAFPEPSSANQIVVSSILIVPDVPTTGNMHQLSQAASDIRTEPFGAVAIQLSSNNAYDEADWHRLTSDFVKHLQPLVCRFDNPRSQSDANTFHSFDLSIAQNSTQ